MQQGVGRTADRRVQDHRVFECVAGEDLARRDILFDEPQDLFAGEPRVAQVPGQWSWDERRARQRQPERLGQDLAGARAAHELAGATRRAGHALGALELLTRQLASVDSRPQAPHLIGSHEVGAVELRATRHVNGRQVAARNGHQVRRHGLVVAGDENHAVVRMAEGMNLDHRGHDVARHQRVAHAGVGLGDAVADIAHREDARLTTGLEDAVADLLDQRPEVKGAGMTHAVRAVDEDLGLGQVFLGPVHAQPQRVALKVHLAQALAAQLPSIAGHVSKRSWSVCRGHSLTAPAAMPAMNCRCANRKAINTGMTDTTMAAITWF